MSALDLRSDPQVKAVDRRRGHRFQPPKADLAKIPALYATDEIEHLHYFVGACDWYLVEVDPETMLAYGYADLGVGYPEWGYIPLDELALAAAGGSINGHSVRFPVERDLYFDPTPFSAIAKQKGYHL